MGNIYLEQNFLDFSDFFSLAVDFLGKLNLIHGMNQVKILYRELGFVGLKMSYKMPRRRFSANKINLFHGFLDIIFPKIPVAGINGLLDHFSRFSFAHCD